MLFYNQSQTSSNAIVACSGMRCLYVTCNTDKGKPANHKRISEARKQVATNWRKWPHTQHTPWTCPAFVLMQYEQWCHGTCQKRTPPRECLIELSTLHIHCMGTDQRRSATSMHAITLEQTSQQVISSGKAVKRQPACNSSIKTNPCPGLSKG